MDRDYTSSSFLSPPRPAADAICTGTKKGLRDPSPAPPRIAARDLTLCKAGFRTWTMGGPRPCSDPSRKQALSVVLPEFPDPYRCGGSAGLAPASQFSPRRGHLTTERVQDSRPDAPANRGPRRFCAVRTGYHRWPRGSDRPPSSARLSRNRHQACHLRSRSPCHSRISGETPFPPR